MMERIGGVIVYICLLGSLWMVLQVALAELGGDKYGKMALRIVLVGGAILLTVSLAIFLGVAPATLFYLIYLTAT